MTGAASPFGIGRLAAAGWELFGYAAVTFSAFAEDAFRVHGNLGVFRGDLAGQRAWRPTWGVASQWPLVGPLSGALEIASGDPYAEVVGGTVHGGFRYQASDQLQLDLTVGSGLWGRPRMPTWATAGFRVAFGK